jgi:hypothetical protein
MKRQVAAAGLALIAVFQRFADGISRHTIPLRGREPMTGGLPMIAVRSPRLTLECGIPANAQQTHYPGRVPTGQDHESVMDREVAA